MSSPNISKEKELEEQRNEALKNMLRIEEFTIEILSRKSAVELIDEERERS